MRIECIRMFAIGIALFAGAGVAFGLGQPGSGGTPCYGTPCGTASANPECTWAEVCTEPYCWLSTLGGWQTYDCPMVTRVCKFCEADLVDGVCVINHEECTTEQEMDVPNCYGGGDCGSQE